VDSDRQPSGNALPRSVSLYQVLADTLVSLRVTDVFTLMEKDTAKLTLALEQNAVNLYHTRHEAAAIGMADGYARVSHRVGVALIGHGPSLTNALTAIMCAHKGGAPVIVLTGESALAIGNPALAAEVRRDGKYFDQVATLSAMGISAKSLRDPNTAAQDLRACFAEAAAGKTLVVGIPTDVMEVEVKSPQQVAGPDLALGVPLHQDPDVTDAPLIDDIADLLETSWAARRPVILAGRGARGIRSELIRLGELTGALLCTTLAARSLFEGEPYDVGVMGSFSTPLAVDLFQEADVLMAFGASISPLTSFGGSIASHARLVQFDRDPEAFGRYRQPDLSILGSVEVAVRAIVAELERRSVSSTGYRIPEIADMIATQRLADTFVDTSRPGALDPRTLMLRIDELLPRDRSVIVDAGHHMSFSTAFLKTLDADSFVFALDNKAVGSGFSIALGASVARPNRVTVVDVGDGGLMMGLGDLDTAVRYKLPLLILVSNDGGFASEVHYLQLMGLPDGAARYINPEFAPMAKSLGLEAITITALDDIPQITSLLESSPGPWLADCKLSMAVRGEWVEFSYIGRTPGTSTPGGA
jgi:acetolactate synthase I/II/III large subunit